jgi:MerR family transcriptional regulator, mercuric resistance operon regulatory protein
MTAIANSRELTIGQLSRVAQVPIETIRYWERLGLAPIPPRSKRGHRLYNDGHVQQLVILRRARRLGFGLRDLPSLLKLSAAGASSCADVRSLAERHLERVRAKLAHLTAIERLLADAVRACSENPVVMCPLLDLLDNAASDVEKIEGAMPRSRSCC